MHGSGSVLIPIPIPGILWKLDSRFRFQEFSKCLIPIPIPVKSEMIPESIRLFADTSGYG